MPLLSKILTSASLLLASHTLTTNCKDIERNPERKYNKYVSVAQYRANNPIEDRICVMEMQRFKGVAIGVFDGHGGDLCAEFAAANMPKILNEAVKRNHKKYSSIKKISTVVLQQTFQDIENAFKAVFLQNIENISYKRVGACALVGMLLPTDFTFASSGDCQVALIDSELPPQKLNKRFNAGEPEQQQRLKKQFPNQSDIVKCIPNTSYCYVKGRLQPTRSLGDFYLKSLEYNFTNLPIFTGPYITHRPYITSVKVHPKMGRTLVFGTDGLWDELDENDMTEILRDHHGEDQVAELLLNKALKIAMERNKISSREKLDNIVDRRNLHDDISIVAVDILKFIDNQVSKSLI